MCATQSDTSPIFAHLKQPSMVDFPGRLAAVMFTAGCNFRCGFCHNAALMGEAKPGLSWERIDEACRYFRDQWADGIVISGGEPTLWGAKLERLVRLYKKHGFAVKLDTNGSRPDVLRSVLPYLDYVAMDIKCRLPDYAEVTKFADTRPIVESLEAIKRSGVDHEFRTTLIEPLHTDEHLAELFDLVRGARRYVLQPFVPRDNLADRKLRQIPRTSPNRLQDARELLHGCADEVLTRDA